MTTVPDSTPATADTLAADGSPGRKDRPLRLDGAFGRQTRDDWQDIGNASLKDGRTLDELARMTLDKLAIDVLYDSSAVDGRWVPGIDAGTARAVRPRRDWNNRVAIGQRNAAEARGRAMAALQGGATSIELAIGATPENPDALGIDALDEAMHDIHLDMISLSLDAGDEVDKVAEALLAICQSRQIDPTRLQVFLNADPIGTLARFGTSDIEAGFSRLGAFAKRAVTDFPLGHLATCNLSVHHNAGASVTQELVAGMASATLQLEHLLDAGLSPAQAVDAISFRVSLDADIVAGVVKLRALERLWRHILTEHDSDVRPVARPCVVAETSHRHLSRLDPWVNHLRNIAACTAAAIGDADTIIVHPHDLVDGQRIGVDGEVADRIARNLPMLLAEECGLRDVADAAGGAHAVESMTEATVDEVWRLLGELQAQGGLMAALADGRWQTALSQTHAERVARLQSGTSHRIGVTLHRPVDAPSLDTQSTADAPLARPSSAPADSGTTRRGPMALHQVREASMFEAPTVTGGTR